MEYEEILQMSNRHEKAFLEHITTARYDGDPYLGLEKELSHYWLRGWNYMKEINEGFCSDLKDITQANLDALKKGLRD